MLSLARFSWLFLWLIAADVTLVLVYKPQLIWKRFQALKLSFPTLPIKNIKETNFTNIELNTLRKAGHLVFLLLLFFYNFFNLTICLSSNRISHILHGIWVEGQGGGAGEVEAWKNCLYTTLRVSKTDVSIWKMTAKDHCTCCPQFGLLASQPLSYWKIRQGNRDQSHFSWHRICGLMFLRR